ncbi:MAG: HDOD domain-containing protein [Phycisphaerales bacterium]
MSEGRDNAQGRRIELVLEQVDSLPTLPAVASRLLRASSAEDADFKEIVKVIESDPSMTAKLLGLCRMADRARAEDITTVDRAVVFLGFEAVRSAALSVNIYEVMSGAPQRVASESTLDRKAFWRHSIAAACAAESISREHKDPRLPKPTEAFVCGLLHGLGVLALEYVLPRAYARVLEVARQNGMDLAPVERKLLGVDHHTAGRRLAEKWGLPSLIHDAVWLVGMRFDALPDIPNKRAVGMVNVAVALARQMHLGHSGDAGLAPDAAGLAREVGLNVARVESIRSTLHEAVTERAAALGIEEPECQTLLLESISEANRALDRLRAAGAVKAAQADRQARFHAEIATFQQSCVELGSSGDIACAVARSAGRMIGADFVAVLREDESIDGWEARTFVLATGADGVMDWRAGETALIDASMAPDGTLPPLRGAVNSWGQDGVVGNAWEWALTAIGAGKRNLRALPTPTGTGSAAVVLYSAPRSSSEFGKGALEPLITTWGAALAAAARIDAVRRLSERLAAASRDSAALRERLTEAEALRRVAQLAAGVVGEMGKPITVIRSRAEVLAEKTQQQRDLRALEAIQAGANRLEALMNTMRLFAEPPSPVRAPLSLRSLLGRAMREASRRVPPDPRRLQQPKVRLVIDDGLPVVVADTDHVANAVTELVANALESEQAKTIEVHAQAGSDASHVLIVVTDDGAGMSREEIRKAFEPFALQKKSTPRKSLGLLTAKRLATLNDGDLVVRSEPGQGVVAILTLPADVAAIAPEDEDTNGMDVRAA